MSAGDTGAEEETDMFKHPTTRHALTLAATLVALAAAEPAFAQTCTTSVNFPLLCQGGMGYGTSDFRAGWQTRTGVTSYLDYQRLFLGTGLPVPVPRDYAWAGGSYTSSARVFGRDQSLADAELSVTHVNASLSARVMARFAGVTAADRTYTNVDTMLPFFGFGASVSRSFDLGLVSVSVSASVVSMNVVRVTASYTNGVLNVSGSPHLYSALAASASADVLCGGAGVEGSATLLDLDLPASGRLQIVGPSILYSSSADLALTALTGHISAYVDYCFGSESTDVVNFSAYAAPRRTLYSTTGVRNMY